MSGVKSRTTPSANLRLDSRLLLKSLMEGVRLPALNFRRPDDVWPWLLLLVVIATTLVLVPDVVSGRISLNYQGDQGVRIYAPTQDAEAGLWPAFATFRKNLFGFHPPGDALLRALSWATWRGIGGSGLNPIAFNLLLGLALGAVTVWLFALVAYHAAGWPAGLGTIALLTGSFVVNDTRLSAMGEATFMPWVAASMYFLAKALERAPRHAWRPILLAALCALASGLFRPEFMFLFPGCCLALWMLAGFWPATAFGAIGASFPAVKILLPLLGISTGLTMLNAGSLYFAPKRSWSDLPATPFFQQMASDPAMVAVLVGALLVLCHLILGARERTLAWKVVLLLALTSVLYIGIISLAIVTQLATHNSYRLATPIVHLLAPAYVISAVEVFRRLGAGLSPDGRGDWRIAGGVAGIAVCVLMVGKFWYVERAALQGRDGVGMGQAMNFVLGRMTEKDAIFLDRARYWENLGVAFFAAHKGRPCVYSSCEQADAATAAAWSSLRKDNAEAGTIHWGEFSALRSHVFIRDSRPKFIVVANAPLLESWRKVAKSLWKEEWETWYSHIYPYLMHEVDFRKPQPVNFLTLGTVRGRTYFNSYVKLVPRWRNKNFLVFEAFYGNEPPQQSK